MPPCLDTTVATSTTWPYPRWIAHRGAGTLAPENTLAAFRVGASHGYRMFECDAKLSAEGVVFLLHDDTLERTSNGQGLGGDQPWSVLSRLDAGGWHSPTFAGEPLPTLEAVARFCLANGLLLNIEIKPTTGLARETGRTVAREAARLWARHPEATPPLLSSFEPDALQAARATQPELPRGLLLETLWSGWLATAIELGCQAVICEQDLWDPTTVAQVHQAGLRTLAYTVNEESSVQRLLALGIDGLITDRVNVFSPD